MLPEVLEKELKRSTFFYEQFVKEFNDEEKQFFMELLKRCVYIKGYPRCEELYYFCYFSTIKRRLERMNAEIRVREGLSAYLFAFGIRDVNEMVKYYENRLKMLTSKGSCNNKEPKMLKGESDA